MPASEILAAPAPLRFPAAVPHAWLEQFSVLEIAGADAVEFLHSQLTQDVKALGPANARLAGYCTAKGRLLASLLVWKAAPAEDGSPRLLALVDAGLAAALQKRLSMFVLRAKVKIAVSALRVAGVWADPALPAAVGGPLPDAPWQRADLPTGTWIATPGPEPRWWWIGAAEQWQVEAGTVSRSDAWRASDIAAGIPWITAATQDLFVPQTVNLELIDGVSFTKGCYPGQEVVARSHYLGKLKRRMFAGRLEAPADAAGLVAADVYEEGSEQPCGRIVNAAPLENGVAVLFESALAAAGALHAGAPAGPRIERLPLPYSLPETEAA